MSVRELYEDGVICKMFERGLITPTVFRYAEIDATVKYFQTLGFNKTQSVKRTADNCRVCEPTVWRVIRIMKD